MFLNRAQLSVRHAASTDETRYHLNCVRVEPDGRTVATDGHRLYTVTRPNPPKKEEFPDVPGVRKGRFKLDAVSLPLALVAAVVKAIPKLSHMPILSNALLDESRTNRGDTVTIVTTDLEMTTPHKARKVEGEYPPWRKIMPGDDTPKATIAFNWTYLAALGKALNEFDPKSKSHCVVVEIYDEMRPAKFTATSGDGETFTAVLSPMRR
jgi:DNA polymerase III sliding clamp (beta) subunit (PCNA family)